MSLDRKTESCSLLPVNCYIAVMLSVLALSGCVGHLPRIVISDDPLTAEEHLNLGVSYESKNEHLHAIEQYRLAAKGELKARAELYMGNSYFGMGHIDEAESHYRSAIKADPGLAEAYNNLAWLYAAEERTLHEAESLVLKAIDLSGGKDANLLDTLNTIRSMLQGSAVGSQNEL